MTRADRLRAAAEHKKVSVFVRVDIFGRVYWRKMGSPECVNFADQIGSPLFAVDKTIWGRWYLPGLVGDRLSVTDGALKTRDLAIRAGLRILAEREEAQP